MCLLPHLQSVVTVVTVCVCGCISSLLVMLLCCSVMSRFGVVSNHIAVFIVPVNTDAICIVLCYSLCIWLVIMKSNKYVRYIYCIMSYCCVVDRQYIFCCCGFLSFLSSFPVCTVCTVCAVCTVY